jgi:hypothetical protein
LARTTLGLSSLYTTVFQSGVLGTVGFREGILEVLPNLNKILGILNAIFVFINLFL